MKKLILGTIFLFVCVVRLTAADALSLIGYTEPVSKQDDIMKVWITAASSTQIEYKTTPQSLNRNRIKRSEVKSVYFFEPPIFKEAMELYESRDYRGAREKFAACKEAFDKLDNLKGNYGTLAGFYELETCRKMFDLESLKKLLAVYQFGSLAREHQRNQLEVYAVWDAVRTKSWSRLDALAVEVLEKKKWVGEHVAQIKYCHGLALEGLGRDTDALIAFNGAFTADYTASEELTQAAAVACLRIIKANEEVKLAIQLWGTEDEDPNSPGYFLLQEGLAMCDLWKKALGGGKALPSDYTFFLRYREDNKPKPKPKPKPKADTEEKPKEEKAEEEKPEGEEKPKEDG
ncbi:MAG: hypothetical protein QF405_14445 [Roseibacillus sp.]|jgi:hypothetical protein|nr:hypothetical protein [Roseibacillus sp.]MDP7308836.1 hypothetical protein [Roseibacillus sp.]